MTEARLDKTSGKPPSQEEKNNLTRLLRVLGGSECGLTDVRRHLNTYNKPTQSYGLEKPAKLISFSITTCGFSIRFRAMESGDSCALCKEGHNTLEYGSHAALNIPDNFRS
jgi:hypothetical protein